MLSSWTCSRMSPQSRLDRRVNIQQAGLLPPLFTPSSSVFSYGIPSVLTADEGVTKQTPTQVQKHERSSPDVSGGREEAASTTPSDPPAEEEPGVPHEELEERREGGASSVALSLTAATSQASLREQVEAESSQEAEPSGEPRQI